MLSRCMTGDLETDEQAYNEGLEILAKMFPGMTQENSFSMRSVINEIMKLKGASPTPSSENVIEEEADATVEEQKSPDKLSV